MTVIQICKLHLGYQYIWWLQFCISYIKGRWRLSRLLALFELFAHFESTLGCIGGHTPLEGSFSSSFSRFVGVTVDAKSNPKPVYSLTHSCLRMQSKCNNAKTVVITINPPARYDVFSTHKPSKSIILFTCASVLTATSTPLRRAALGESYIPLFWGPIHT